MDKKRNLPYYYNKTTKETVWVRPVADDAPPPDDAADDDEEDHEP
jgi:hypothetical protein